MVQVVVDALGETVKRTNPKYELYHPKWYRKDYPIFWWLGDGIANAVGSKRLG